MFKHRPSVIKGIHFAFENLHVLFLIFSQGLFVIKPSNKKVCYVSQFNTTALAPPKQAREHCESKEEHNHVRI